MASSTQYPSFCVFVWSKPPLFFGTLIISSFVPSFWTFNHSGSLTWILPIFFFFPSLLLFDMSFFHLCFWLQGNRHCKLFGDVKVQNLFFLCFFTFCCVIVWLQVWWLCALCTITAGGAAVAGLLSCRVRPCVGCYSTDHLKWNKAKLVSPFTGSFMQFDPFLQTFLRTS